MQIRDLFNKEDRAVSPVIGVILMVAITVILAAIIGTFVLGLGQNVNTNAQAGVTFQQDSAGDTVTITVNSIQRADKFEVKTGSATPTVKKNGGSDLAGTQFEASVGDSIVVDGVSSDVKITVVATYDGNENVIGEYTVK